MRSILILLCIVVTVSACHAVPVQWTVGSGGNGHWYEYVGTPVTDWDAAAAAAAAQSWQGSPGYLTTITSAAENAFIQANIWAGGPNPWRMWLGGYQDTNAPDYLEPGGGWRWITGEAWSYTNWQVGEPNNSGEEHWLGARSFGDPAQPMWYDTTYTGGFPGAPSLIDGYMVEYDDSPVIPEPSSMLLAAMGGSAALGGLRLRRRFTRG